MCVRRGGSGGCEGSPSKRYLSPDPRSKLFLSYGEHSNCVLFCSASLSPPLRSPWPSVAAPNLHLSASSSPTWHFGSHLKDKVHHHELSPHLRLPPVHAHGEHVPFLLLPPHPSGGKSPSPSAKPIALLRAGSEDESACQLPCHYHGSFPQNDKHVRLSLIPRKRFPSTLPLEQPSPSLRLAFTTLHLHTVYPLVTATHLHCHHCQFWLLLPLPHTPISHH